MLISQANDLHRVLLSCIIQLLCHLSFNQKPAEARPEVSTCTWSASPLRAAGSVTALVTWWTMPSSQLDFAIFGAKDTSIIIDTNKNDMYRWIYNMNQQCNHLHHQTSQEATKLAIKAKLRKEINVTCRSTDMSWLAAAGKAAATTTKAIWNFVKPPKTLERKEPVENSHAMPHCVGEKKHVVKNP